MLWFKIGICSCLSGFLWGSISDRWGRKLALLGVFAVQGASFLLLGTSLEVWAVYVSAGLFAITAWSVPALMAALSGDIFGARLAPAALGLMTIVFGAGQALGPWFAGWVADIYQSFSGALLTAGLVAISLGAGGTLLLGRGKSAENDPSKMGLT
jgi:MFS family permease